MYANILGDAKKKRAYSDDVVPISRLCTVKAGFFTVSLRINSVTRSIEYPRDHRGDNQPRAG